MMYACVLVRVLPGKVKTALNSIKRVERVVKALPVYGRYDIVVFIEAPDLQSLSKASGKINAVEGVKSTETAIEA